MCSAISYLKGLDRLDSWGQTDILALAVEDDVELPDEDISKDPQLVVASTKAGPATIGRLKKQEEMSIQQRTDKTSSW